MFDIVQDMTTTEYKKRFILFFESELSQIEAYKIRNSDPIIDHEKSLVENLYERLRIEFDIPQEEIDKFKSTENFKRYMNGDSFDLPEHEGHEYQPTHEH